MRRFGGCTHSGKVTSKDIENALGYRDRLVAEIKERLEKLGGEGSRFLRGSEALKRKPVGGRLAARHIIVLEGRGRVTPAYL